MDCIAFVWARQKINSTAIELTRAKTGELSARCRSILAPEPLRTAAMLLVKA
jgi:hypothetical protein